MTQARVRIGKITLKAGGASVRVLERPADLNGSARELRGWTNSVLSDPQPPDAIACVALIWSEEGGTWLAASVWHSTHPAFPHRLLPHFARETLQAHMISRETERAVMRNLGYRPVEPPDGAA